MSVLFYKKYENMPYIISNCRKVVYKEGTIYANFVDRAKSFHSVNKFEAPGAINSKITHT